MSIGLTALLAIGQVYKVYYNIVAMCNIQKYFCRAVMDYPAPLSKKATSSK